MSDDCEIYVVACVKDGRMSAPVKVEISSDARKRLGSLQTACPYELNIVRVFSTPNREIAKDLERAFHKLHAKHQTRGEWFDIDPMEAVWQMCLAYRLGLSLNTTLDEDEYRPYLGRAGVLAAEKFLGMERID